MNGKFFPQRKHSLSFLWIAAAVLSLFLPSCAKGGVTSTQPAQASINTKPQAQMVLSAQQDVNMRSGPSADSSIVSIVKEGSLVEVLESDSLWYKIRFEGKDGYVNSAFLKTKYTPKPASAPEKTPPAKTTATQTAASNTETRKQEPSTLATKTQAALKKLGKN